jgi:hypothetical protein
MGAPKSWGYGCACGDGSDANILGRSYRNWQEQRRSRGAYIIVEVPCNRDLFPRQNRLRKTNPPGSHRQDGGTRCCEYGNAR